METQNPELYESFAVRYGDIVISISSDPDGLLENKNENEILKYCADVLLRLTDDDSLESKIEIPVAIQETLEKDFGWDRNRAFDFMRKLKKRLYMMNIGESESKEERYILIRQQKEERAKEKFKEATGMDPDEKESTQIVAESNVVMVLPSKQNFSKEDRDHPITFVTSGDDASAITPKNQDKLTRKKTQPLDKGDNS